MQRRNERRSLASQRPGQEETLLPLSLSPSLPFLPALFCNMGMQKRPQSTIHELPLQDMLHALSQGTESGTATKGMHNEALRRTNGKTFCSAGRVGRDVRLATPARSNLDSAERTLMAQCLWRFSALLTGQRVPSKSTIHSTLESHFPALQLLTVAARALKGLLSECIGFEKNRTRKHLVSGTQTPAYAAPAPASRALAPATGCPHTESESDSEQDSHTALSGLAGPFFGSVDRRISRAQSG